MVDEQEFEAFKAFFDSYFQIFEGKHTDWMLLNEPEIGCITPGKINKRYEELISIFEKYLKPGLVVSSERK